jgi:hypothetical protein
MIQIRLETPNSYKTRAVKQFLACFLLSTGGKSNQIGATSMPFMEESVTSEKRQYPRCDVDLPVKYSRTNQFFKHGRATNASEGGLLISLPEKMDIGHHLVLKLFFPLHSGRGIIGLG